VINTVDGLIEFKHKLSVIKFIVKMEVKRLVQLDVSALHNKLGILRYLKAIKVIITNLNLTQFGFDHKLRSKLIHKIDSWWAHVCVDYLKTFALTFLVVCSFFKINTTNLGIPR
jgi:hypothetical protein